MTPSDAAGGAPRHARPRSSPGRRARKAEPTPPAATDDEAGGEATGRYDVLADALAADDRATSKPAPKGSSTRGRKAKQAPPAPAPPAVDDSRPVDPGRRRPRPEAVTSEVMIRGKARPIAVTRPRPTMLGRRYAVVYDVAGPRVTIGVLWFAAVVGALALGPPAVAPLYACIAGLAGYQTARAWRALGSGANPFVAAAGALGIAGCAAFGIGLMGLAILVLAVAAVVLGAFEVRRDHPLFEAAGTTVQSALFAGLAAASVVLTLRLEIGAVVTLVLFVSAYEMGDFIVGSGASSSIEGPIAGIFAMAVVCGVVAVLRVPPFDGATVFVFGGFAAVGCPLGQLAASVILPRADSRALALRRLDSLIVLGPLWVLLIGIYLERLAT